MKFNMRNIWPSPTFFSLSLYGWCDDSVWHFRKTKWRDIQLWPRKTFSSLLTYTKEYHKTRKNAWFSHLFGAHVESQQNAIISHPSIHQWARQLSHLSQSWQARINNLSVLFGLKQETQERHLMWIISYAITTTRKAIVNYCAIHIWYSWFNCYFFVLIALVMIVHPNFNKKN